MDTFTGFFHSRSLVNAGVLLGIVLSAIALFFGTGLVLLAKSPKSGHPSHDMVTGILLLGLSIGLDAGVALISGPVEHLLEGYSRRLLLAFIISIAGAIIISFVVSGGRWVL